MILVFILTLARPGEKKWLRRNKKEGNLLFQ
jgi:hypothetical protein